MSPASAILAVTPGEPAGIGPEITLKLAAAHPELPLVAVADPACLRITAATLGIPLEITEWQPGSPLLPGRLACLPVALGHPSIPGQVDPRNGAYVVETLSRAAELVLSGDAGALVTGPVNKAVINQAGIFFSGHTEFLARLAGCEKVVMMLAAPGLRVALVTTHLPLSQVPAAVTAENVEQTIRITVESLQSLFGIERPRLQVLGLNPHAGEQGHLGTEDEDIIRPAIERCRPLNATITGPVPADTAFTPPRLQNCDAVIAMYHDQGLPVLKHAGFGHSVNITLGLPFVRTSVDHGTALDIAGSGRADAGSFYHAALMAGELAKQRGRDTGSS